MTPTQRAAAERILSAWEPHCDLAVIEDDVAEYHVEALAMVRVACEVIGKDMAEALGKLIIATKGRVPGSQLDQCTASLAAFRELNQCP